MSDKGWSVTLALKGQTRVYEGESSCSARIRGSKHLSDLEKLQDCAQLRQLLKFYIYNILCIVYYAYYSLHNILCILLYT